LEVREGEPLLDPSPAILLDVKLDAPEAPRPETDSSDFLLKDEVLRLMDRLDEFVTITIQNLEIRAGIPRRVIFRAGLPRTVVLQASPINNADQHAGVFPNHEPAKRQEHDSRINGYTSSRAYVEKFSKKPLQPVTLTKPVTG
jgi:hypothetical protein